MTMDTQNAPPMERRAGRWNIQPWPVLCFVTGVATLTDFQIVGRIMGTEILVILLTLGLAMFTRLPKPDRLTSQLIALALLWLVAQFVSDMANGSSWDNTLRGMARAGITMIMLYGLHIMLGNRLQRVRIMFIGLSIGGCLAPLVVYEPEDLGDIWKFGYGTPVTMLCMALAAWLWHLRLRLLSLLPPFTIALVNISLGFRSMGGIALAVTFIQILLIIFGTRHTISKPQSLFLSGLAVAAVTTIIPLYGLAAESGWLGQEQQDRYLEQVDDDYGILLSGRSEWRIAPLAFLEKPLLGHGSWAEDERYAQMSWEFFMDTTTLMPTEFSTLIPTHSHLWGALVEGGVFSGLFWIMVLFLMGRCVLTLIHYPVLIDPIISFVLIFLGWAVLFSPYGLSNRVFACFGIASMSVIFHQARHLEQSLASRSSVA